MHSYSVRRTVAGIAALFLTGTLFTGCGKADDLELGNAAYARKDFPTAVKHYKIAVEQGHAEAQYGLGMCYILNGGIMLNPEKGVELIRKSAGQGYPKAEFVLGQLYMGNLGGFVKPDRNEADKWAKKAIEDGLRRIAERGDVEAQSYLAQAYGLGQGVAIDQEQFLHWTRLAAEQGHAGAQASLGLNYLLNGKDENDAEEAVKWLGKAAEQNEPRATRFLQALRNSADQGNARTQQLLRGLSPEIGASPEKTDTPREMNTTVKVRDDFSEKDAEEAFQLAKTYLKRFEVEKSEDPNDLRMAFTLFRTAADHGHVEAQLVMAQYYLQGKYAFKNNEEAVKWLRKAADQGHPRAQYALGTMYRVGDNGMPEDQAESQKWYAKAMEGFRRNAEKGDPVAQWYLGEGYKFGQGVKKDPEEAVKWYRKAAEQDHAEAQASLGLCYENGFGVTKDMAEAEKWFRKGAENGSETARFSIRRFEK